MRVGVDVGGTKVLAVRVEGDPGAVRIGSSTQVSMPGRRAPEAVVEKAMIDAVLDVAGDGPPETVGVSAAGLVDRVGETVRFAAHLPWRDAPVRERIANALASRWPDSPPRVLLDNDANCAGHAELVAGAARGVSSAVLVTVGTGIGGALIVDGRVIRGAHGAAGEFGHVQVVPDGLPCECGLRGCWEQYVSGRALERVMRVTLGSHLDGREVTVRAHAGDPVARQAFDAVGAWLGVGVAGLVSSFDPEVVVIGGGVSAAGDLLLDPARRALGGALQGTAYREVPPVVQARFGPEASAVGAALLAAR